MFLNEFFKRQNITEGGNLSIDQDQAQHIDLKVHDRKFMVPLLNQLLQGINAAYSKQFQHPLWDPKLIQSREFLSGSSLHFFNTDIPDEQFIKVKPKVGDIDTQVDKTHEEALGKFLDSAKGKMIGPAKFLGYERGNEQYSSLWEFQDPPIKIQIDFEFVGFEKGSPTPWAKFSHSSAWEDMQENVKGVFHKWIIQAIASLTKKEFLLLKMVGRGKARAEQEVPTTDNLLSFAVSSKEGGGLRAKYEPVLNDRGIPIVKNGLPVMKELPPAGYEQNIGQIFSQIFDKRLNPKQAKQLEPKFWSFVGILDIMNQVLSPEDKEQVLHAFLNKLYGKGAQGLYKNNPQRDAEEKDAALNKFFQVTKMPAPPELAQMKKDYQQNYRMVANESRLFEAPGDEAPAVKAQFRKGMPHLHDLKPIDFLDLLDEIHDGNGRFRLKDIPLNVKVDGFGGRFGKNAEGRPFMATSRSEPRYEAGFVSYHQKKGTNDPEVLNRAKLFDNLFHEMMRAVEMVDSALGPDFLVNKQVTCEVLYLPFAQQTDDGRLKFVGIAYDKLPEGVELALVPFRVVDAATGEDLPDAQKIVDELTKLGQQDSVMFINNRLTQNEELDVTAMLPPLENIEELKNIMKGVHGKRDKASLEIRRQLEDLLKPIQEKLEQAIIKDPNIIGKDMLGKDYEGIVINSRLGPIKVTSQEQRNVISAKQDAKKAAREERPRENENKTAVVAIGSFVGHKGHEELFNYTIQKAHEVQGDPYLFIGNAVGKDDPIPTKDKVETWHKLFPEYAKNISTVTHEGGTLIQKIKHELINPLPGKPPRYDHIIIMVGEDQANLNMPAALMKAVNKFQGYEHVKVELGVTPRGTGMSFTKLRNILKDPNATEDQQLKLWCQGFDVKRLGVDWIKHLMDITKQGMGIAHKSPSGVKTTMPKDDNDYNINYGKDGVAAQDQKNVGEDLNYNARIIMIKQIAKATGWGISELSLSSNEELQSMYNEYVRKKQGVAEGMYDYQPWVLTEDIQDEVLHEGRIWNSIKNLARKLFSSGETDKLQQASVYSLEQGLKNLKKTDYNSIDQLMKFIGKQYKISPKKLHNLWVSKHQVSPDDWIKGKQEDVGRSPMASPSGPTWDNTGGHHKLENWDHSGSDENSKGGNGGAGGSYVSLRRSTTEADSPGSQIAKASKAGKKLIKEMPIEMNPEDPMNPTIFHKSNPAQLKMRMMRASGQMKDLAARAQNASPLEWQTITRQFKELQMNIDEIEHALAELAKQRRKGGIKSRGIDPHIDETKQRLDPKCWKGYRKQGTKMKGNTRVNNCVPVGEDVEKLMSGFIRLLESK